VAGGGHIWPLNAVYLVMGVAIAFGVDTLLRLFGVRSRAALVVTTLFVVSPSVVLFENYLFYDYPLLFCTVGRSSPRACSCIDVRRARSSDVLRSWRRPRSCDPPSIRSRSSPRSRSSCSSRALRASRDAPGSRSRSWSSSRSRCS
jgi:hypothetical protein